jgi:hypothetical protein
MASTWRVSLTLVTATFVGLPFSILAQDIPLSVSIRYGELKTECYPSCDHSTEWLQQLYAEVRDSSGTLIPSAVLEFDWGVDNCNGLGYHHGFVTGVGLDHIAVDGNLFKNVPDCCPACDFQAYDVGVRVRWSDEWYSSLLVRVPNIFIPDAHALLPNHPNPFNTGTTIPFDLSERSRVRLEVVDVSGRTVAILAEGSYSAGRHAIRWSADAIASGAYVARLSIHSVGRSSIVFTRRLVLIR